MKALILFSIFSSFALTGYAQNAQAYFNSSANYYVKDKKVEAMQTIRDGLTKFPNDEKLKALAEKMKQEKKEQEKKDQEKKEQEKKEQEKKEQEKKDPQNKDGENKDQQKKEQEKKEEEKKKDQQDKNEKKDQQKKDSEKEKPQTEQEKKDQQKQNAPDLSDKLQKMNISEEKAKMLLEAMKNQEIQYLQQNKRKATKSKDKSKPDW